MGNSHNKKDILAPNKYLYSPSLELESWKNSPSLFAYIQNLQSKLGDYESLNVRKISPGLELPLKGKKIQIEILVIEESILNKQITGYFINSKPVTINFSSINSDDPQLQGINWGCFQTIKHNRTHLIRSNIYNKRDIRFVEEIGIVYSTEHLQDINNHNYGQAQQVHLKDRLAQKDLTLSLESNINNV
ncbi:MAG: hypothetical protein EZS28_023829 [Streblomastix strix]|uniref:Uncharacterized protein n=1 Tax=Streblomastix strix TaxID=222440 RepID=A0A5J4VDS3_9EUKA|nr:MAG: hypothetical protein EZS28_023829 [Streblomastix strix]